MKILNYLTSSFLSLVFFLMFGVHCDFLVTKDDEGYLLSKNLDLSKLDVIDHNSNNNNFNSLYDSSNFIENIIADESSSNKGPSVSCYWVNTTTLDVWDLTPLRNKDFKNGDYILNAKNGRMAYNFCNNTLHKCATPSQAVRLPPVGDACAKQLAGDAKDFNLWRMMNDKNNSEGVIIFMNYGETCFGDQKFVVQWNLKCNFNMEKGYLNITSPETIDLNTCLIQINGQSLHGN